MPKADPMPDSTHAKPVLPQAWLNLAAALPFRLPVSRNPDGSDASPQSLSRIYSQECAAIEMLDGAYGRDEFIPIPPPVLDLYRLYRPTPLCRAHGLEEALGYDGELYFKREDWNPTGSHKPNTAIPQVYYAATQGLRELVTDTGAGQWGSALAWACNRFGLDCTVFMTASSYKTKRVRATLMELAGERKREGGGASVRVYCSPSDITEPGRALRRENPDHPGSLGIGMGEAMHYVSSHGNSRLALGCMSYYAAMHQTIIAQELDHQLAALGVKPDIMIGCVGGGTNFVGFVATTALRAARANATSGQGAPRMIAAESANVPVLTTGKYEWENADYWGFTPVVKMYTLGRKFIPPEIHSGGLRYHGKSPILSLLRLHNIVEASAITQEDAFAAGVLFFRSQGVLIAPETGHAVAQVIEEVRRAKQESRRPTIVFCLSGTGYLDVTAYEHQVGLAGRK